MGHCGRDLLRFEAGMDVQLSVYKTDLGILYFTYPVEFEAAIRRPRCFYSSSSCFTRSATSPYGKSRRSPKKEKAETKTE